MNRPSNETPPTTFGIWSGSFDLIRRNPLPWLKVGLVSIVIPWIFVVLLQGWKGGEMADRLGHISVRAYTDLIRDVGPFLFFWLATGLLLITSIFIGFLSFIRMGVWEHRNKPLDPKAVLGESFRLMFPRGLILLMVLGILSAEQAIFGPFRIFSLFAAMACVIIIADGKKPVSALKQALLFRYTSPVRGGGPAAAFALFGLSAVIFTLEYGMAYLYQFLLTADQITGFGRDLWMIPVPGTPMTLIYLTANILLAGIAAMALAFVAGCLVCLYYSIRPSIQHLT